MLAWTAEATRADHEKIYEHNVVDGQERALTTTSSPELRHTYYDESVAQHGMKRTGDGFGVGGKHGCKCILAMEKGPMAKSRYPTKANVPTQVWSNVQLQ